MNEFHIKKYGKAWDAFLRGEDLKPEGILIEECPEIPRERLAGLKSADVRTVEELAGLPDRSLQRLGPDGRALQKAAQAYLESQSAPEKMAKELDQLREKYAELEARLNNDGNATPDRPKRRGRPRRTSTE